MTRIRTLLQRALPLALLPLLAACQNEQVSEFFNPPQDVQASSEFRMSTPPGLVHNNLLSSASVKDGQARVDAGGPGYLDIRFFPITDADALNSVGPDWPSSRQSRDSAPDLSGVDFSSHFVFLVAHPELTGYAAMSSGQYATFFSSVKVAYLDDRVVMHLDASRLGDISPMVLLGSPWAGKLYTLERRGRKQLEVKLYENRYQFTLVPEVVPEVAPEIPPPMVR
ncbi:hypothetical protein [Stenotrophomonas sp. CC120222-04]|uniref:hypothetical protein n=1 Tax=Stenotrophomonas sp. CC120222-04 TaxID=1378088 RepID=UPI000B63E3CF|nr:hypothetical protein [Stenotrophomonas sp. CC120222-04]SNT82788.1 hypothetical protein SAMN02744786_2615 [Stenotrophomonas sp. CC120222-04]